MSIKKAIKAIKGLFYTTHLLYIPSMGSYLKYRKYRNGVYKANKYGIRWRSFDMKYYDQFKAEYYEIPLALQQHHITWLAWYSWHYTWQQYIIYIIV